MSIARHYLLEQIKRSRIAIADENRLYDLYTNDDSLQSIFYNKGAMVVLDELENIIKNKNYNKYLLRKILKKTRHVALKLSNKIEKRYEKDFDSLNSADNRQDYIGLFVYYGIEGQAIFLTGIINGKLYIDKSAYIPTDWKKWLNS